MSNWYVFMHGEEDEYSVTKHSNYNSASLEARGRAQTEKSPKRWGAGFYEVKGISGNTYFVSTFYAAQRHGYGDLLAAWEKACEIAGPKNMRKLAEIGR